MSAGDRGDIGLVKAALKAFIVGPAFEAQCQAVDQRYADGLVLERLGDDQVETTQLQAMPPRYPFLEIVATTEELPDADNDSDADIVRQSLDLIVWVNGDSEREVTKRSERYVLALRKLVRKQTLMPLVASLPMRVLRAEYGVLSKGREVARPFVMASALSVQVTTIEV